MLLRYQSLASRVVIRGAARRSKLTSRKARVSQNAEKEDLHQQKDFNEDTQKLESVDNSTSTSSTDRSFIDSLTNRGDFYGVKPRNNTQQLWTPEMSIANIKNKLDHNQRITAENVVRYILVPLQEKNEELLRVIRTDSASYIPWFIRCCGLVISDISEDQKLQILENLIIALKDNGFKLDLHAFNAILAVWRENSCDFDVDDILRKVEIDHQLEPNVEFYNHLLWRLGEKQEIQKFNQLVLKMKTRGLVPNFETELAHIFGLSSVGRFHDVHELINRVIGKYGENIKPFCFGARIRGAANYGNIDDLTDILRKSVIITKPASDSHSGAAQKFMLNIYQEDLFDLIWRLAKMSRMSDGQQYAALTTEILNTAQRTRGFFKRLVREAERHIAHGYYYSATTLIQDTTRLKQTLETQHKSDFMQHLMPRLANHMIRNKTDPDVIKDVSNRLIVSFGPECRFYDSLMFSVLMFKGYNFSERFSMFSKFVDAIDPDRVRPHLLFPLFARCPDLQARQQVLYHCSEIGYRDMSFENSYLMVKFFYEPLLEKFDWKLRTDSDKLSIASKVMESYGLNAEQTWKILYDYAQRLTNSSIPLMIPIPLSNYKKWLKAEYERLFKDKTEIEAVKKAKYTYPVFQRLLKDRDVEKIHSFLIQRGSFPSEINFEKDLDVLLSIYLSHANMGYIKKLLQMLSNISEQPAITTFDFLSDEEKDVHDFYGVSPVKNYHLLQILRRYATDTDDIQSVIEYVYELKRLFPEVIATHESRHESTRQYERLFASIFNNVNVTPETVSECVNLVTLLYKQELIALPSTETLTVFIIEKTLSQFSWDLAVDTWLKFQSSLYCANGIFALMKYAVNLEDNAKIQYLLHRASNFIASSRVNTFLAAAYVFHDNKEKAKEIFEQSELRAYDCLNTFRLLLGQFRKNGILDFAELTLQYTDLKNEERMCNAFINHWLYFFGNRRPAVSPLKFYDLFKKYGVYLKMEQMKKLYNSLKPQQEVFEKWVFNPQTALLNVAKSYADSEWQQTFAVFEKDFKEYQEHGHLIHPEPVEAVPTIPVIETDAVVPQNRVNI